MVESHNIDRLFYALSDATRRDIVDRLCYGELSINEIAGIYDVSLADISKHVKILHEAGLVVKRKSGRNVLARANLEALAFAEQYLAGIRTQSLSPLE